MLKKSRTPEELKDAKIRIKELEKENLTLKGRLDELRRAKLQTIVKKEGTTSGKAPTLGRKPSSSVLLIEDAVSSEEECVSTVQKTESNEELTRLKTQLKQKEEFIKEMQDAHERGMAAAKAGMLNDLRALRDKHTEELKILADDYTNALADKEKQIVEFKAGVLSDSSNGLDQFKKLIEALRADNEVLRADNELKSVGLASLEGRVKDLLAELSEKEAAWCQVEEKLKIEIQKSWGERYQAWMQATEKKIEELRKTNEFLKETLQRNNS